MRFLFVVISFFLLVSFSGTDARQTSTALAKLSNDISLEELSCEEWIALGTTLIILAVGIGMAFLPGGVTATVLMTAAVANAAVTAGGGFVMALSKKICVFFGFKPSAWHEAFLTITTTQFITNKLDYLDTDAETIVELCRTKYKRLLAAIDPARVFSAQVPADVQDQEFLLTVKQSITAEQLATMTTNYAMLKSKRDEMDTATPKTSKRFKKAVVWLNKALREITDMEQRMLTSMAIEHKRIFVLEQKAEAQKRELDQLKLDTIAAQEAAAKKVAEALEAAAKKAHDEMVEGLRVMEVAQAERFRLLTVQVTANARAAEAERVEWRKEIDRLKEENALQSVKLSLLKQPVTRVVFAMPVKVWGDTTSFF